MHPCSHLTAVALHEHPEPRIPSPASRIPTGQALTKQPKREGDLHAHTQTYIRDADDRRSTSPSSQTVDVGQPRRARAYVGMHLSGSSVIQQMSAPRQCVTLNLNSRPQVADAAQGRRCGRTCVSGPGLTRTLHLHSTCTQYISGPASMYVVPWSWPGPGLVLVPGSARTIIITSSAGPGEGGHGGRIPKRPAPLLSAVPDRGPGCAIEA